MFHWPNTAPFFSIWPLHWLLKFDQPPVGGGSLSLQTSSSHSFLFLERGNTTLLPTQERLGSPQRHLTHSVPTWTVSEQARWISPPTWSSHPLLPPVCPSFSSGTIFINLVKACSIFHSLLTGLTPSPHHSHSLLAISLIYPVSYLQNCLCGNMITSCPSLKWLNV